MKNNISVSFNSYGEKVTRWTSPCYVDGKLEDVVFENIERHDHSCLNGKPGTYGYWVRDYQGIELCKVCDDCRDEKLSHYRPEILEGYNQSDVDEPIDEDM